MKSLIAYSSVVHIGVVSMGIIRGYRIGYSCAIKIVIAHGFVSPILFAFAYMTYNSNHSRLLTANKGALSVPFFVLLVFLLLAINMGVPPTVNLWREVEGFIRILSFMTRATVLLILAAFLGAIYNLFLYVSLRQSKESFTIKNQILIWPLFRAATLAFLWFLGLAFM